MSLIDDGDDAIDLRGIDVGRARVEIRYHGDGERRHGPRPRGERKIDLLDHEPAGLDGHGPDGQTEADHEEPDRPDDERLRAERRHHASSRLNNSRDNATLTQPSPSPRERDSF